MKVKFIDRLEDVGADKLNGLLETLKLVVERFAFRASTYYLDLIDWDAPSDPIRRTIIPDPEELAPWGKLDASNELKYTVLPGVQHKYSSTALLLVSNTCGGLCRYCFRKRIFMKDDNEVLTDLRSAVEYLRAHKEVTNVLLTGGDALMLSTEKLKEIIERIIPIEHIGIIRLGTKILSFNPYRIIGDDELIKFIREVISWYRKKIYVITHFSNPKELTSVALKAVQMLQLAGVELANQTPLIRGINDDAQTLATLFRRLAFAGIHPYYIFQCRPAVGNKPYAVPIEEAYTIFEHAKAKVSGLAKRARYVMSHKTGKIEIVGLTADKIFFKYHRAAKHEDSGKFIVCRRNPEAYWLEDYSDFIEQFSINSPSEEAAYY